MTPSSDTELPSLAEWQTPLAWYGAPLRPVLDTYLEFPERAVFVRAALVMTMSERIGPGTCRQTQATVPGLLRMERGKAVEAHALGPDGRCWTFRAVKPGRKTRWACFAGDDFPATGAVEPGGGDVYWLEQVVVQSIVPMQGTRRHVSLAIHDDGRVTNFATAVDEDPND